LPLVDGNCLLLALDLGCHGLPHPFISPRAASRNLCANASFAQRRLTISDRGKSRRRSLEVA
ncbi:hypothetical protein, partial [Mesorhizobium sp. P5_C1]